MEYLFKRWEDVERRIAGRHIMLFLDYDGTLAPIADEPARAIFPKETKRLLALLARRPRCRVAIVSGRAIRDVKNLVGLGGIVYIGNHGLEVEGPKAAFKAKISARYKTALKDIKEALRRSLSTVDDLLIEDKGATISVHYRLVGEGDIAAVKNIFHNIAKPYLLRREIRVVSGKKVFEIRPPDAPDKGSAVQGIIESEAALRGDKGIAPVYIGDDTTDEDAFRKLKNKAVTVFVGRPYPSAASSAAYYVRDTGEVALFLRRLKEML